MGPIAELVDITHLIKKEKPTYKGYVAIGEDNEDGTTMAGYGGSEEEAFQDLASNIEERIGGKLNPITVLMIKLNI